MNTTKRRNAILERVAEQGSARVSDLASDLGVSLETIRRDVRPLVERGELVKTHGVVFAVDAI